MLQYIGTPKQQATLRAVQEVLDDARPEIDRTAAASADRRIRRTIDREGILPEYFGDNILVATGHCLLALTSSDEATIGQESFLTCSASIEAWEALDSALSDFNTQFGPEEEERQERMATLAAQLALEEAREAIEAMAPNVQDMLPLLREFARRRTLTFSGGDI